MIASDLLILGVGIHAIEMADIVERINAAAPTWKLLGHIAREEDSAERGDTLAGRPVLGKASSIVEYPDCHVAFEHDFHDPIDVPPSRWASLVDPSCFIASESSIGPGCVLYPGCFLGARARLDSRVFALSASVINHDDVIQADVTIASGVMIAGSVTVERGCYLGQGCSIRQKLRIGGGSLLGMGSVILHDVPPNSVMVGNPARVLR